MLGFATHTVLAGNVHAALGSEGMAVEHAVPLVARRRRWTPSSSGTATWQWSGTGINDAPALARATVGIAMGTAGNDAAIETADIAPNDRQIEKVGLAIVPLAPGVEHHPPERHPLARSEGSVRRSDLAGYASLRAAITTDIGATLVVTFNSLRLLKQ